MHKVARKSAVKIMVKGAAHSLDLGRTFVVRRVSGNSWEVDARALSGDWHRVGADMSYALEKFKEEMDDRKKA